MKYAKSINDQFTTNNHTTTNHPTLNPDVNNIIEVHKKRVIIQIFHLPHILITPVIETKITLSIDVKNDLHNTMESIRQLAYIIICT